MSDAKLPERPSNLAALLGVGVTNYNVRGWWWLVGGKDNLVFSSAKASYFPLDDPDYKAFLEAGEKPTTIACDGELADVLARAGADHKAVAAAGWWNWGFVQPLDRIPVVFACGISISCFDPWEASGVYALDTDTRTALNTNVTYINANGGFPNGDTEKLWPDIDGKIHIFPTVERFMQFAGAVADYVAGVNKWAAEGGTGMLPSMPITIGPPGPPPQR